MKMRFISMVFVVIMASLFVNLWGITHDAPHSYEHDEINFVVTALSLGKGELNTGFIHGSFLYHFLFFEYVIFYFIKLLSGSIKSTSDFLMYYVDNPWPFFLIGRVTIAFFSSFSVLLVYLIGKKILNKFSGLLAAIFFAFSLLHVNMAHVIKSDVIYVFFLLLSFLCIMQAGKGKRLIYLSAFIMGLAISVKYLAVFGIFFILPGVLSEKKSIREIFKDCIVIGVFATLGFFIGQPFILIHIGTFFQAISGLSYIFKTGLGNSGASSCYLYFLYLIRSIGIYLTTVFLLSSLSIFNKNRRRLNMLILPYIVIYFLFIFSAATAQPNFLMAVLPFICIYTAVFVVDVVSYVSRGLKNTFVYSAIGLLLISPSFLNVLRYDYLLTRPDTRAVAKTWIEDNIPEDSSILIEGAFPWKIVDCPPLVENKECLLEEMEKIREKGGDSILWKARISRIGHKKAPKFFLEKEGYFNKGTLMRHSTDYVIVCSYHDHGFRIGKMHRTIFYKELSKKYSLIKKFMATPYIVWFPSFNALRENPENLKYVNLLDPGQDLIAGPNIFIYKKVE